MTTELQRLVSDLTAADSTTRVQAAERLSQLGPEAAPAAVALVRACGDDSEAVREYVVAALEELGSPAVADLDELAALLSDPSADVGYWSATLLGRLGPDGASAVPHLIATLTGGVHGSVRQRVAWALGRIGPSAFPALNSLKQAASSGDPRLARLAERAIQQIGE